MACIENLLTKVNSPITLANDFLGLKPAVCFTQKVRALLTGLSYLRDNSAMMHAHRYPPFQSKIGDFLRNLTHFTNSIKLLCFLLTNSNYPLSLPIYIHTKLLINTWLSLIYLRSPQVEPFRYLDIFSIIILH